MKNLLCVLIFLAIPYFVFGQNLDKLDSNNGFRQFKFSSSPSQIKNIERTADIIKLKDVVSYEYIGSDIKTIYGVKVSKISFQFFKNKLYSISVKFGSLTDEYDEQEYRLMHYALQGSFGSKYHKPSDYDKDIISYEIWDGDKVRCDHARMFINGLGDDLVPQGFLLFIYKPLKEIQQASEF